MKKEKTRRVRERLLFLLVLIRTNQNKFSSVCHRRCTFFFFNIYFFFIIILPQNMIHELVISLKRTLKINCDYIHSYRLHIIVMNAKHLHQQYIRQRELKKMEDKTSIQTWLFYQPFRQFIAYFYMRGMEFDYLDDQVDFRHVEICKLGMWLLFESLSAHPTFWFIQSHWWKLESNGWRFEAIDIC